MEIGLEVIKV